MWGFRDSTRPFPIALPALARSLPALCPLFGRSRATTRPPQKAQGCAHVLLARSCPRLPATASHQRPRRPREAQDLTERACARAPSCIQAQASASSHHVLSERGCTDVSMKGAETSTPLRSQHRKKLAPPVILTPAPELPRPRTSTPASAKSKAGELTSARGDARISTEHRPRVPRTMHWQVGSVSEWLREQTWNLKVAGSSPGESFIPRS